MDGSRPLSLRSDNGLVFSSRHYTGTVKAYGLTQEFTTPYTPEQDGLVERFFRSLKEECIWLHRFESLGQARIVIDRWIRYYNEERPHQSLDYVAPRAHLNISCVGCAENRGALHIDSTARDALMRYARAKVGVRGSNSAVLK
ncbi:integrase core domain-containing protein [Salinicola corii]|uniref:integrase core domain-containing protein n=1 Tax=Salinicola corii TaxID=2606937 RepID=UPI0023B291F0|nr:integrase core domain-containing protein [Salinicola corii]